MHNLELLEDATHGDDIHFTPGMQPQVEAEFKPVEESGACRVRSGAGVSACICMYDGLDVVRFQRRY